MHNSLLRTIDLNKTFVQGSEQLDVLKHADLRIEAGELVALVGPSGAGKSTLLQIIGLLDQPTSGKLLLDGHDTQALKEKQRTEMRRQFIGFVYQFHYLLPEFTALENVALPQMIAGVSKDEAHDRAKELLDKLELGLRLNHRPARLSGGEQQRVAIARALANNCKLLLADEPTGNLDPDTANTVFDMLVDLVKTSGIGALIATHNIQLAERMDRMMELKAGRIMVY